MDGGGGNGKWGGRRSGGWSGVRRGGGESAWRCGCPPPSSPGSCARSRPPPLRAMATGASRGRRAGRRRAGRRRAGRWQAGRWRRERRPRRGRPPPLPPPTPLYGHPLAVVGHRSSGRPGPIPHRPHPDRRCAGAHRSGCPQCTQRAAARRENAAAEPPPRVTPFAGHPLLPAAARPPIPPPPVPAPLGQPLRCGPRLPLPSWPPG